MNTIELNNDKHTRADFARLRSVLACASKDETRAAIAGRVLVENEGDGITIIATDGRRMRADAFDLAGEPGLYDIKVASAKSIVLMPCREGYQFPNYRQVIPSAGKEEAYELNGTGKQFVLWAASALGCWLDPKLVELGEDEEVVLHIRKDAPELSPVLLVNDATTLVVMPIRVDQPWVRELEAIRRERMSAGGQESDALAA